MFQDARTGRIQNAALGWSTRHTFQNTQGRSGNPRPGMRCWRPRDVCSRMACVHCRMVCARMLETPPDTHIPLWSMRVGVFWDRMCAGHVLGRGAVTVTLLLSRSSPSAQVQVHKMLRVVRDALTHTVACVYKRSYHTNPRVPPPSHILLSALPSVTPYVAIVAHSTRDSRQVTVRLRGALWAEQGGSDVSALLRGQRDR